MALQIAGMTEFFKKFSYNMIRAWLILLSLTLIGITGHAQIHSATQLSYADTSRWLVFHCDVGILGTSAGVEMKFASEFSARAELNYFGSLVGIPDFVEQGSFGHSTFLLLRSALSLEPRYYYNLNKSKLTKNGRARSTKYFSVRLQYNTPWLLNTVEEISPSYVESGHEVNPKFYRNLDLIPLWGFRTGTSIYFDFNVGYIFHLPGIFNPETTFDDLRIRLLCRLGYRF